MRKPWFVLAMIALVTACGGASDDPAPTGQPATAPSGPTEAPTAEPTAYRVLVDAPTPDDVPLAFPQYFPGLLTVHPGDSVTFENSSSEAPHTVTFGVGTDPEVRDRLFRLNGTEYACAAAEPPAEGEPACDAFMGIPDYAGEGFWNSGAFDVQGLEVRVDPSTPPGTYPFVCLYHVDMNGILEVVPPDAPADDPAEVLAAAREGQAAWAAKGPAAAGAPVFDADASDGEVTVAAGWGTPAAYVNSYAPAELWVPAGTQVTWRVFYGHNISFTSGLDEASPDVYTGEAWSYTFDRPGTYDYLCTYHDRMKGTITVT
jgi:plastocyanin